MLVSLLRGIKFAFQDFGRNIWLSLATIGMLVVTLLIINIFLSVRWLAQQAILTVENKLDISVFFHPEVAASDIVLARDELSALPQVSSLRLLSKEERIQQFQKQYQDDTVISQTLEEIQGNPFGAVLIVRARNVEDYSAIINVLKQPRYASLIEETDYKNHQTIIERIAILAQKLQYSVQILGLGFATLTILIILNTIRMTIYTHRNEIKIMKMVGAGNWFIRGPFLLQGILYSVISMAIVGFIWYPILKLVDPYLISFLGQGASLLPYYLHNLWKLGGIQFLSILLFTMAGAGFAIGRYLKA